VHAGISPENMKSIGQEFSESSFLKFWEKTSKKSPRYLILNKVPARPLHNLLTARVKMSPWIPEAI